MSDLYELLVPYLHNSDPNGADASSSPSASPFASTSQIPSYLGRLTSLSLEDLASTEPQSLQHTAQSHLRNVQALSKRSHKAVIASASHLSHLTSLLPTLKTGDIALHDALPALEKAAAEFAEKYDRSTENAVLDRRKRALLLSRNIDRVSDVLDLPTLLSSTVAAGQTPNSSSAAIATTSYASALDLHAHIRRLNTLYPQSRLVGSISQQAEDEIANLTTVLIVTLQSPSLKLAGAMRTISWLRRVARDLADDGRVSSKLSSQSTKSFDSLGNAAGDDGALGSLFLVCRLRTLHNMLEALEPLEELADQETAARDQLLTGSGSTTSFGGQTERYLKRYIEIFREQSFSIISMYKSIFPNGLPRAESERQEERTHAAQTDQLLLLPPALSTFAMHLVNILSVCLRKYLPNVIDRTSRESLLTQVLYCAGSLGRLGADFGMVVALLEEDTSDEQGSALDEPEWVQVTKKYRVQAGRLEVLARGVGNAKNNADIATPV